MSWRLVLRLVWSLALRLVLRVVLLGWHIALRLDLNYDFQSCVVFGFVLDFCSDLLIYYTICLACVFAFCFAYIFAFSCA